MSDAIGTNVRLRRTRFAEQAVRRQPQRHAGTASLAGTRCSRFIEADDPGGGPGR